jgi:hypothetical protein
MRQHEINLVQFHPLVVDPHEDVANLFLVGLLRDLEGCERVRFSRLARGPREPGPERILLSG